MLRPVAWIVLVLLAAMPARGEDANTLNVGGALYRLGGIDAPEADQNCLSEDGELYPCGHRARAELAKFIVERPIECVGLRADPAYAKRQIGQCSVGGVDLHHWLVLHGWALSAEPGAKGRFKTDEDDARAARFGLWKGCFVAPEDFRRWNKRSAKLLGPSCPADARERLFPEDVPMPRESRRPPFSGHYV